MSKVVERREIGHVWDDDRRLVVQVSENEKDGYVGVRVAYYQENGRFGASPPHIPPEYTTDVVEAIEELSEVAEQENLKRELDDVLSLVRELGSERAREVLEEEVNN